MSLPSVDQARAAMLAAVAALPVERVPLAEADGRWLAEAVTAVRDQPPFAASAMDGWAVHRADAAEGARLQIVGESAAGGQGGLTIEAGQAARIFTGAPIPAGADAIVIQERARRDDDVVVLETAEADPAHLRPRGGDFRQGDALLAPGVRLNPWRLALAAAAGRAEVACIRRPRVLILPSGDELVTPGQTAEPHQIYDAAGPAVAAFARSHGAGVAHRPPLKDDDADIRPAVTAADGDLLVLIGGASVGDHDRLRPVLRALGAVLHVEGCAVRPGKPIWFAVLPDGRRVLGLPGNPASALVCAELFLAPVLAAMQGGVAEPRFSRARLIEPLPANGPREHYMRARLEPVDGEPWVRAFASQDSSLVSVMAAADVLIRRLPGAAAAATGDSVDVLFAQA